MKNFIKLVLLSTSFSFACLPAFVQAEEKEEKMAKYDMKNDMKNEVKDYSSSGNRKGKSAYIAVEAGLNPSPFPSSGLDLGYYLSSDLLLVGSYTSGSFTITDVGLAWSMLEARARYFVGNSFYLSGGLGIRTFTFDMTVLSDKKTVESRSMGLEVGIGNQWQWGNFTLGVDWFGYFTPISNTSDDEIAGGAYKDLNDALENLGKAPHPTLLRVALGVSI